MQVLQARRGIQNLQAVHIENTALKGRHANPNTLAFLECTLTRERFQRFTENECLEAFYGACVFEMRRHSVYLCFQAI